MKKSFFLLTALAALVMVSCGSSKSAVQTPADVEVNVPCTGPEFFTSAEYFRANASGTSNSMEIANQKAMTAARTKLAASIETTVKTVAENFLSSYEDGQDEESRGRFQSLTREVVNQKLNGIRVICSKTTKSSANGQFTCYVAIELAGAELTKEMQNRISNDSKLRTDFEYSKFENIFNEEMKALATEQGM